MYMHDIPTSICPKFADDLVAVSVGEDIKCIAQQLQQATDDLLQWSQKWSMSLNASKTKVMLFGNNRTVAY